MRHVLSNNPYMRMCNPETGDECLGAAGTAGRRVGARMHLRAGGGGRCRWVISKVAAKAVTGGWKSGCGARAGSYTAVGGQSKAVKSSGNRTDRPLKPPPAPRPLQSIPGLQGRRDGGGGRYTNQLHQTKYDTKTECHRGMGRSCSMGSLGGKKAFVTPT